MSTRMWLYLWIFTLMLLSVPTDLQSQSGNTFTDTSAVFLRAKMAVENLKAGALVIRLPLESQKTKELDRMLKENNLSRSRKKKLQRDQERIRVATDSMVRVLTDLFSNHYSFSKVYFLPDTASQAFLGGKREGLFFNDRGEFDPNIRMKEAFFIISRIGRTTLSGSTGIQAIVFQDAELKDLDRPFPYFIRLFSLKNQLITTFEKETYVSRADLQPRIQFWNDRLMAFYELIKHVP